MVKQEEIAGVWHRFGRRSNRTHAFVHSQNDKGHDLTTDPDSIIDRFLFKTTRL